MRLIKTKLNGVVLIQTKVHSDNRGFFKEVYKNKIFDQNFKFDCMSRSKKNVLRGLHIQTKNPQGKFVTVVKGQIFDVAVDLRRKSKSFGKYFSIKMSESSDFSIYIPPGFAHGFLCLSKDCIVYYKCTNYRDKNSETTIDWNDKNININWPISKPLLSKKDKKGLSINDYLKNN